MYYLHLKKNNHDSKNISMNKYVAHTALHQTCHHQNVVLYYGLEGPLSRVMVIVLFYWTETLYNLIRHQLVLSLQNSSYFKNDLI